MAIEQDRDAEGTGRGSKARPKEDARRLKEKASEAARDAAQRGKEQIESTKSTAADQVGQLASVVDNAARQLQEQDSSLARYAGDLAGSINRFADGLRNRSVDDLAGDLRSLAHRNPTMFLLGSVAVGVALSRFLKASSTRSEAYGYDDDIDPVAMTESQGPGTPYADQFTAPTGTAASPLHSQSGLSGSGMGTTSGGGVGSAGLGGSGTGSSYGGEREGS